MRKQFKKCALVGCLCALATGLTFGVANLQTASADATPDLVQHGASVRMVDPSGLRFTFSVDEAFKDAGYTFGTMVIPKAVLGNNTLNHNDDTADEVDVAYELIAQEKWATDAYANIKAEDETHFYEEGREYFNAVLLGIPSTDYSTELVARSYAVKDGVYYYSEPVERSIAQVAAAALRGGEEGDLLVNYVDTALSGKTLSMNVSKAYVAIGATQTLDVLNDNGYAAIWSSSSEDVASVDANGVVTAKAAGTATISATIGSQTVNARVLVGEAIKGEKIVDFTADNAEKQVKGGNSYIGYSEAISFNGEGMLTATNSMNWHGTATFAIDLSYYSTINFNVYQNTTGSRFVKVMAKDSSGGYNVVLFNKTIDKFDKGEWASVSIDVSALETKSTELRIAFGTANDNGSEGDVFYFTDFYGEKAVETVLNFTAENAAQAAKGSNAKIGYSNDVFYNGDATFTVANSMNWEGSATLLNPVDVSGYQTISFSVYQKTTGGRMVRVYQKDANGNKVQLASKQTNSGAWTKFELNVDDMVNTTTDLIIYIGTNGQNGSNGDVFYFTDIYGAGERIATDIPAGAQLLVSMSSSVGSTFVNDGSNAAVAYTDDYKAYGSGMAKITATSNWQAAGLYTGSLDVSAYSKIIFKVFRPAGEGGYYLRIKSRNGSSYPQIYSETSTSKVAGEWVEVSINVSDLTNKNLQNMYVQFGTTDSTAGKQAEGTKDKYILVSDIYGIK